jgi:hypothetical protein
MGARTLFAGYAASGLGVLCLLGGVVGTVVLCGVGHGRCERHPEIQVVLLAVFGLGVCAVLVGGWGVLASRGESRAR